MRGALIFGSSDSAEKRHPPEEKSGRLRHFREILQEFPQSTHLIHFPSMHAEYDRPDALFAGSVLADESRPSSKQRNLALHGRKIL